MGKKTIIALLTLLTIFLLVVSTLQYRAINSLKETISRNDTVTRVVRDTVCNTRTVRDTVPKLKYKYITKRDTLYKDSIPNIVELQTKTFENTLETDSDTISYQAHISGYDLNKQGYPKLDSINLHRTFKTVTVYQETVIEKQKPQKQNKWHFQPSFGIGYGLTQKKCDMYLGLSLGYNIFGK